MSPRTPLAEGFISSVRPGRSVCALKATFDQLTAQVRAELSGALSSPMGPMIRSYLPQVWVFETEKEVMTLAVDVMGRTTVFPGGMKERDVTIQMRYDPLIRALATRDANRTPPSDAPRVSLHSQKGSAAFSYLRNQFGL